MFCEITFLLDPRFNGMASPLLRLNLGPVLQFFLGTQSVSSNDSDVASVLACTVSSPSQRGKGQKRDYKEHRREAAPFNLCVFEPCTLYRTILSIGSS
jgi:hypothetical protein